MTRAPGDVSVAGGLQTRERPLQWKGAVRERHARDLELCRLAAGLGSGGLCDGHATEAGNTERAQAGMNELTTVHVRLRHSALSREASVGRASQPVATGWKPVPPY